MLLQPNPPWHHTILNQFLIDRILDAIPKVLVTRQVAHYVGINPDRIYEWLKFGKRDMDKEIKNSIYADFYQQYHEKRAEVLHERLNKLAVCPKNYGAITWVLERAFKDDFEIMSESHKQLLELVENMMPILKSQGVNLDGKETEERRPQETQKEVL